MHTKTYIWVKRKRLKYYIVNRVTIQCLGGENNKMEKPQLTFVDDDDVPKSARGKKSVDYGAIFAQIPKGKTLKITKDTPFSISYSVARSAVAKINKNAGETKFTAYQRTVKGEQIVFVSRV